MGYGSSISLGCWQPPGGSPASIYRQSVLLVPALISPERPHLPCASVFTAQVVLPSDCGGQQGPVNLGKGKVFRNPVAAPCLGWSASHMTRYLVSSTDKLRSSKEPLSLLWKHLRHLSPGPAGLQRNSWAPPHGGSVDLLVMLLESI